MAETKKRDLDDDSLKTEQLPGEETAEEKAEEKVPLNLAVDIQNRSTCERHIKVTIPREDIERYFDKELSDLMPNAQIPGFRVGELFGVQSVVVQIVFFCFSHVRAVASRKLLVDAAKERVMGFEPTTTTLARWRSTN